MQTFLPDSQYSVSARMLDDRRLGKQRVECKQVLIALYKGGAWENHPATRMWKGYEGQLVKYYEAIAKEWCSRGFVHKMRLPDDLVRKAEGHMVEPFWLGNFHFHESHQSNLVRKYPERYRPMWSDVPDNIPYLWPVNKDYTRHHLFEEAIMVDLLRV